MSFAIRELPRTEFPSLLLQTPQCPKKLFIRGELPAADSFIYICVVGSRATSPYGLRVCASLVGGLAGLPVVIVSGLALGLDAQAHKAALDAGLPTVAVVPSGLDDESLYPSSNRPLAARILAQGGALISEYPAGTHAAQWTFPARNRIMAGISRATLVIEASEKSGTLITAGLALDYNREVYAVPHPILQERGAGCNRLIREGALLVRSSGDIIDALGLKRSSGPLQAPQDINPSELALLRLLVEPLSRDELFLQMELPAQEINIALTSLAIRGLIIERMGKIERTSF